MGNGVQMLAFSMAWWKFCLTWFDVTAGAQGFQGFLSATASDWIPISQINPTFIQSPDQLKFSWNLNPHWFPLNRWQIPGSFEGGGRFGSGLNCRTETDLCKVSTVQSLYAGAICIKIIEIHIWVSWTKGKVAPDVFDKDLLQRNVNVVYFAATTSKDFNFSQKAAVSEISLKKPTKER